ncbi:MAG: pilus assembly protein TadG-related protein [Ilumatobacteraceae bacterium]
MARRHHANRARAARDGLVRDHGQAAVAVVIVVVALATLVAAGLAELGGVARDRVRAQSAADAAALASLDGGRTAATRTAAVNDATVVSWTAGPGAFEVSVTVRVGGELARASASNQP